VLKNEDRNIWKIHLDKDDFVKAQEAAKGDIEKMEEISTRQADYYFEKKEYGINHSFSIFIVNQTCYRKHNFFLSRYEKSAVYYALTKSSFEEIALKFSKIEDSVALKTFLMKVILPNSEFDSLA